MPWSSPSNTPSSQSWELSCPTPHVSILSSASSISPCVVHIVYLFLKPLLIKCDLTTLKSDHTILFSQSTQGQNISVFFLSICMSHCLFNKVMNVLNVHEINSFQIIHPRSVHPLRPPAYFNEIWHIAKIPIKLICFLIDTLIKIG
jgi:hypothetical protein